MAIPTTAMRGAGNVTTGSSGADNTQAVGGAYHLLKIINDHATVDLYVRPDADATAEPRMEIKATTSETFVITGVTNFHYTQASGTFDFRYEAFYNT